ncbi:hypothetical protein GIB67_034398, partial [Kingdonia uniflora]
MPFTATVLKDGSCKDLLEVLRDECYLRSDETLLLAEILLELQVDDGYWSGLDSTGNELALVPIEPSRSSLTIAGGPTLSNTNLTGYVYNFYDGNNSGSPVKIAEH